MPFPEQWTRLGRHINPWQFFAWTIGVNLPIALVLSACVVWHNSVVGKPEVSDLVLRALAGLFAFSCGLAIVWVTTIRPAIRRLNDAKPPPRV